MSTETKRDAAVYRKAAQGMEDGELGCGWSCWAIEEALGLPLHSDITAEEKKHPLVRLYEATFMPEGVVLRHSWGNYWPGEERHNCRILALCFMAAMVEAGDA